MTVGGGTGSYTVLSGLKNLEGISLTAIVSMADNGGSTRILRDELGVLPPGDVRQCLVALSEHSEAVRKLMSYRFAHGSLKSHSFGNILLAALEKVTGRFSQGVRVASEILKVKGEVIPVTDNEADLCISLTGGKKIKGQIEIGNTDLQKKGFKKIFFAKKVKLNERAREALLAADYVIIGPGTYYESLVPNLIVPEFKKTLKKSGAKIILPVNLTNKKGHTLYWKASDYVKNTEKYLGRQVDFVLLNNQPPSLAQIRKYKLKEGDGVLVEDDFFDPRAVRRPLISHALIKYDKNDVRQKFRSFIRHDSKKIAKSVAEIIKRKIPR